MQTHEMTRWNEEEALSHTDGGTLSQDVISFGGSLPRGESLR
jgi:hypothetical protein